MCRIFFLLVLLSSLGIVHSQTDTTFISLKGFEDSVGNTHLYYSTNYSSFSDEVDSTLYFYNFFDVQQNQNSFFEKGYHLRYYPELFDLKTDIRDIEFFDNDPNRYIFIRNSLGIDLDGKISRYDQNYVLGILGNFDDLYLSSKNSDHVYAVASNWISKSYDGGLNWTEFFKINPNGSFIKYLTFSPFDESVVFGINQNNLLVKSLDSGKTFFDVTELPIWKGEVGLLFDKDRKHIYAIINDESNNFFLMSDSNGVLNSWQPLKIESNHISICIDDSVSGNIFMSFGNKIFESTDYGNIFTIFTELPHHANGLYKKPNQELYATISNGLLQIDEDSTRYLLRKIINKSLDLYPIAVGNKWIYSHIDTSNDEAVHPFSYCITEEFTKDTVDENGYHYFCLEIKPSGEKYWFRIDSLSGDVYRRYSFKEDTEYLYMNLAALPGDEIETSEGVIYDIAETDTMLWEQKRYSKIYYLYSYSFHAYKAKFAQGIGIIEQRDEFGFDYSTTTLKGCIISGIIYGDTAVVGVEDELDNLPTKFSLSQNYPNPFNPTTTIDYTIPKSRNIETFIRLNVFDVLGREVATLVNQPQKPGNYKVTFGVSSLSSGIYYYQLKSGKFVKTRKMLVLK